MVSILLTVPSGELEIQMCENSITPPPPQSVSLPVVEVEVVSGPVVPVVPELVSPELVERTGMVLLPSLVPVVPELDEPVVGAPVV
jgi:hypothetical protein